jgi:hypothetical protein
MALTNLETARTRYRTSEYRRAVTDIIDAAAKVN